MAKLSNYKGSIGMTGGFTPKGGQTFPLMEAHDIMVAEDDTRLDEKLEELAENNLAEATPNSAGLMPAADKAKLDLINITDSNSEISVDVSKLRGNSTGFNYQWIGTQKDPINVDDITYEGHYFVIFGTNIPSGCSHGFLDVDYFDGTNFSPSSCDSFEKVIKQTFRSWDTNDIYVRTYKSCEKTWINWDHIPTHDQMMEQIRAGTKYMVYVTIEIAEGMEAHFSVISDKKLYSSLTHDDAWDKLKTCLAGHFRDGDTRLPVTGGCELFTYQTLHFDNMWHLRITTIKPRYINESSQIFGYTLDDIDLDEIDYGERGHPIVTRVKNVAMGLTIDETPST